MSTIQTTFTLEDALQIQKEQLEAWQQVLKPSVHKSLVAWCNTMNKGIKFPDQIKRGIDLNSFVSNLICDYRNKKNGH